MFAGGTVKVLLPLIVRVSAEHLVFERREDGRRRVVERRVLAEQVIDGCVILFFGRGVDQVSPGELRVERTLLERTLRTFRLKLFEGFERTFDAFARRVHIGGAFVLVGLLERQRSEPFLGWGGDGERAFVKVERCTLFRRTERVVRGEHVRKRRVIARRAERLIQIKRSRFRVNFRRHFKVDERGKSLV